jgi:hypothetical protein
VRLLLGRSPEPVFQAWLYSEYLDSEAVVSALAVVMRDDVISMNP